MALEVTVSDDRYPADTVFEIVGLGAFKNGEATEVSEENERTFVSLHQMGVADVIGDGGAIVVGGSSSIENLDDVLGVDVSDRPAPPEEAILNNDSVSDDDPFKKAMLENRPEGTDTGNSGAPVIGGVTIAPPQTTNAGGDE